MKKDNQQTPTQRRQNYPRKVFKQPSEGRRSHHKGGNRLADFNTHYVALVTKAVWYCEGHTDRPHGDSRTQRQASIRQLSEGRTALQLEPPGIQVSCLHRNALDMAQGWARNIHHTAPRQAAGGNRQDLGSGRAHRPHAKSTIHKINLAFYGMLDLTEIKTFCSAPDPVKKMKRQATDREKYQNTSCSTNRIHKQFSKLNNKTNNVIRKWARDMKRVCKWKKNT